MKRRNFIASAASATLWAAPSGTQPAVFELRYIHLRNGSQVQRTSEFLSRHLYPAAQRAGIGPIGFFGAVIAQQSPFVLMLASYPSLGAMGQSLEKLAADRDLQKAIDAYYSAQELSYMRMENSLLRGFASMPAIAVPPAEANRPPRIFELRTYESNNGNASRRKIRMFNEGEIGIFRRLGMTPVFFGETIVGSHLPNLTYMLAFDGLAAREKLWRAFGSDPEWQKMRSQPGVSDAEIVSNISNAILRPLPFSPIR